MVKGQLAMGKFVRSCVTEPNVVMLSATIDSSKWPVIEEGLMCVQGRSMVNPISLNFDDEEFLRQVRLCLRHGAAVVVMALTCRARPWRPKTRCASASAAAGSWAKR